jgi:hypothetical protein
VLSIVDGADPIEVNFHSMLFSGYEANAMGGSRVGTPETFAWGTERHWKFALHASTTAGTLNLNNLLGQAIGFAETNDPTRFAAAAGGSAGAAAFAVALRGRRRRSPRIRCRCIARRRVTLKPVEAGSQSWPIPIAAFPQISVLLPSHPSTHRPAHLGEGPDTQVPRILWCRGSSMPTLGVSLALVPNATRSAKLSEQRKFERDDRSPRSRRPSRPLPARLYKLHECGGRTQALTARP